MKKTIIFGGLVFAVAMSVAPAFAASGVALVNSGLGQKSGDVANFGVAVCNNGSQDLVQSVPIVVTANGQTNAVSSPSLLKAGSCNYSYLSYASFNMASGQTYQATVTIDPNRIAATNSDTKATYNVTVPSGQVHGESTMSEATRQTLLAQLASMINVLLGLLAKARALGL
jgi:hypothetical protein